MIKNLRVSILNRIVFYKYLIASLLLIYLTIFFTKPATYFSNNYSTIVLDKSGELIGARIASDGQWRFPEDTVIPSKFKECIIHFEDRNFYHHLGFNPVSLVRSFFQNVKARKIVSGGSTITM